MAAIKQHDKQQHRRRDDGRRPARRGGGRPGPARRRGRVPDPGEVLPMGRGVQPDPERYRRQYLAALRLGLDTGSESFEVARSRAALLTFDSVGFGLDPVESEAIRTEVAHEEAERRGVTRLEGFESFETSPVEDEVDDGQEPEPLALPRPPRRRDDRVRRGGSR